MRTASRFVATAVIAAGISLSGAPAALAQDTCAYVPEECVEPTEVLPTTLERSEVNGRSNVDTTLPFTGGETAVAALVGVGAIAGGAALVVAARRRTACS